MDSSPSRLKDLFNDAAALPPSEREAFLHAQCHNDQPLRERLEAAPRRR